MTKLHEVAELGQAIWLDYTRRAFTASGQLQSLVDKGLRGVTSNPTIFDKAIAGSADYDDALRPLIGHGKTDSKIYEDLILDDIRHAADVLLPVYERTGGLDGYVSLEVSPTLAHDAEKTALEVKRLWDWPWQPG